MISPDILKNSGSAGLFGFTLVGAVFIVLPGYHFGSGYIEAEYTSDSMERRVDVEHHPDVERPQLERPPSDPPPVADQTSVEPPDSNGIQVRNRAARRAKAKLKAIYGAAAAAEHSKAFVDRHRTPDAEDTKQLIIQLNNIYEQRNIPLQIDSDDPRGPAFELRNIDH